MAVLFGPQGAGSGATADISNVLAGFADSTSQTRLFWPVLLDQYEDRPLIEHGFMAHQVDNGGFVGVAVDTNNIYHTEQNSVLNTLTVASIVSGGDTAGANIIVNVTANSFDNNGTDVWYNYGTVGKIFEGSVPSTQLRVEAVNFDSTTSTHTVEFSSTSTAVLNTLVASGNVLKPQASAFAYGDNFPKGSVRGWTRYGVSWQYQLTSSATVNPASYNQSFEFKFEGQNYIAAKIFSDAILTSFLETSAIATVSRGETLGGKGTTQGYVSAAQTYGMGDSFAAGAMNFDDLYDISDQLDAAQSGYKIDWWGGANNINTLQRNNFSQLTNGAIQYLAGSDIQNSGRNQLKKTLGRFIVGVREIDLMNASEWSHKEMYSPLNSDGVQTEAYWNNAFILIADQQVALQKGMTNSSFSVSAPMVRILQKESPQMIGGQKLKTRVYNVNPENLQKEEFYMTMGKDIAVQTMIANKLYFGTPVFI
jgi:hypothetical protein